MTPLTGYIALSTLLCTNTVLGQVHVWEREVGSMSRIGANREAVARLKLRCGEEGMEVEVRTGEDFAGVLYPRGAFREEGCLLDTLGGTRFSLSLPYAACNTRNESGVYSTVLVVQHDDELITPGDAAFSLHCDLRDSRELTLSSTLGVTGEGVRSRIRLVEADPGGAESESAESVFSATNTVVFDPRPKRKEEL